MKASEDVASAIQIAAPAVRTTRQARITWGLRTVTVGGDAPVRVQSMTNTDTVDAVATAIQVKELADHVIEIPQSSDALSPIIATIPLQLLSYHISDKRGCDVDQPRNLAKSVTVE